MSRKPSYAAVVLAAGASSRMGSPKALLLLNGERFVDRLVRIFRSVCDPVVVVRSAASGQWTSPGAQMIENSHPERGMLSSLQCGLAVLPESVDAVFFTPVDQPAISPETVSSLAAAWAGHPLVIPRYEGRRGHPVLLARTLVPEILALPASKQARDIVQRHASEVLYVDVDDPGILTDADTPDDYRALVEGSR